MKMMKKPSSFMKQIITVLTSKTKTLKTRLIIFSFLLRSSSFNHKLQSLVGHNRPKPQNDVVEYVFEDPVQPSKALTRECVSDPTRIEFEYPELTHMELQNEDGEDQTLSDPAQVEFEYPDIDPTRQEVMDLPLSVAEEPEDPDLEMEDPVGSVIELVKSSKKLREGEEFKLEDDIDEVADLFIRRFHQQMRLQKQQSFDRYKEMLQNDF